MPPSSSMMRGHRVIARILSPFLRWLDRRIDARIANCPYRPSLAGPILLSQEHRQALNEINRQFSESFGELEVPPAPEVRT